MEKTLIQQARQANLAQYLISIGQPLRRDGNSRHKHKEHDSLVFWKNAYYWNSKGESGNAIDYLTRHMGMDFNAAVAALVGFVPPKEIKTATQEKKEMTTNMSRTFAYLTKSRGIDVKLIQLLVHGKLLAQEAGTNNAVFRMIDEHGQEVGAELQGTLSDIRFKGVQAGSKYGYGFNVRYPKTAKTFKYCLFFESAVDLLSFIDLKTNHSKKSLESCILISMGGLKINILEHMQRTFGGHAVLCIDNDTAADEFIAETTAKGIPCRINRPSLHCKDWNELLQTNKKSVI